MRCEIVKPGFQLSESDLNTEVVEVVKAAKKLVDLIGADYIVSVGRGISKDVEGGIKLAEELADVLGGVVGGSRATIDSGWLSADHQVGQTGKTVHPKVYIALGISGAIQHKAGMQDSECIIAVNKNDTAPIFEIADYGICGDLFKVTPHADRGHQGRQGCEVRHPIRQMTESRPARAALFCVRGMPAMPRENIALHFAPVGSTIKEKQSRAAVPARAYIRSVLRGREEPLP